MQVLYNTHIAPDRPIGMGEEQVHASHTCRPSSSFCWKHLKAYGMQWQGALVIYTFLHLTVWKMNPTSQSSSFSPILGKHSSSQYMGTQQGS